MNLLKEKEINGKTIYYGFSIGAYLLMELATKVKLDKIVLVSPTPLFKDGVEHIENDRKINKAKLNTVIRMCKQINCEVEVYVGENEADFMIKTAHKISKELRVKLNIIKGLGHDRILFDEVLKIESGV